MVYQNRSLNLFLSTRTGTQPHIAFLQKQIFREYFSLQGYQCELDFAQIATKQYDVKIQFILLIYSKKKFFFLSDFLVR